MKTLGKTESIIERGVEVKIGDNVYLYVSKERTKIRKIFIREGVIVDINRDKPIGRSTYFFPPYIIITKTDTGHVSTLFRGENEIFKTRKEIEDYIIINLEGRKEEKNLYVSEKIRCIICYKEIDSEDIYYGTNEIKKEYGSLCEECFMEIEHYKL